MSLLKNNNALTQVNSIGSYEKKSVGELQYAYVSEIMEVLSVFDK